MPDANSSYFCFIYRFAKAQRNNMSKRLLRKCFAVKSEMLFFVAYSIGPVAQLDRAAAF